MPNIIRKEYSVERTGDVVIVSSDGQDRMGDVIHQDGWELSAFLQNPQMFYGHNTSSFPVGNWANVHYQDGRLAMSPVFADEIPAHTDAQIVKGLWDRGFLRTVSVGFVPLESKPREGGTEYVKQELLEVSIVPIPANTDAHRMAMKALLEKTEPAPAPPAPVISLEDLQDRIQRLEDQLQKPQEPDAGMAPVAGPAESGAADVAEPVADESITLIIGE